MLNDEEIPVLGIDPFFNSLAGRSEVERKQDRTTSAYVRDNIKQAKFFIHSIHQRNQTLLKVARAVVEYQRAFFAEGPKRLSRTYRIREGHDSRPYHRDHKRKGFQA